MTINKKSNNSTFSSTPRKLIIAEKPSVAQAISHVIGATSKKDGYIQGNDYIVSWCVGHLIELATPDKYNEAYVKWRIEDLPILPENWLYEVSERTQKQYNILCKLLNDKDVTEIICATDAGREGELIFRLVYNQANCKKPFKRLWISSMEETAILEGFKNLKDGHEYNNLYNAALCRAKADWLIGMNATRLYSSKYYAKLNVGRVQTPTLSMIVDRENKITNFQKEEYFTVKIQQGQIVAVSEKITQQSEADTQQKACQNKQAFCISVTSEEKTVTPPKLYDLTTLQREANRIFGYTAQQTLDNLQTLYEKKIVTYPRTDSQYITEDMQNSIDKLVQTVITTLPFAIGLKIQPNTAVITNNAKVSDHHAILPTLQLEKIDFATFTEVERNILNLVANKLLLAVSEKYIYSITTVIFECEGFKYATKGKTSIQDGFKAIENQFKAALKVKDDENEPKEKELPTLTQGQIFENVTANMEKRYTSPPKSYTEDTLLSSMETAGNADFSDNEDVEKKGIGTPATRAGIIEGLVNRGFIERKGKQMIPTKKGIDLISILPDMLKTPKLTAEWETSLQKIEKGQLSVTDFEADIITLTNEIIETGRNIKIDNNPFIDNTDKEVIGTCPRCGCNVYENKAVFACGGCKFALWKQDKFFVSKKKELTKAIAVQLLKEGKTEVKGLYSEKNGKTYDGIIVLVDTGQYVNFKLEFPEKKK